MGVITRPNTYTANTTISPSEVNDDFDTIYNEFNGNISAANLANNAVTTAKITDSNVTTAKIADAAITSAKIDTAANPVTRGDETIFDHVASGGVWSGDAYGSTRNASMTALVAYIDGYRGTVNSVSARTFTASRDTYIDVLNTAGTFSLVYTEVTNNAASPALAANSIRIGIIVTGASNIASVASINQGQEDKALPIASSVAYRVTDSLGNLICPRDPQRTILGYALRGTDFTTATTGLAVDVTGVQTTVNVPTGRKVEISVSFRGFDNSSAGSNTQFYIREGSTILAQKLLLINSGSVVQADTTPHVMFTPTAGSHTYKFSIQSSAGSTNVYCGIPGIQLTVRLV